MIVISTYGLPIPFPFPPIQPDSQQRHGEGVMDFLERIVNSPQRTANDPNMTYLEEIHLVASALSVLTHTRVLPGTITLYPNQKGTIVPTTRL
jgi:hypothetical protein